MVQTSVEMCQEEQHSLWRRIIEYVVIVAAGLFFAILVSALVPGIGSTAHAAAVVQPTGIVESRYGGNVVQPTGIVESRYGGNVVQPTGIVDPKDPNIVQPTSIVEAKYASIAQPTGIVGPNGKLAMLTGIVGPKGDLVQASGIIGGNGDLAQPIAFTGPKSRDIVQQILIAKTTNGNIVQHVYNVFRIYRVG